MTIMINQAAGIVQCQKIMHYQMDSDVESVLCTLEKYNLPKDCIETVKSLSSALDFSARLTRAAAGCFRDLSDQCFNNSANTILMRRDALLDSVKPGITQDTLNKLRTSPIHTEWLFSDEAISKAESEVKAAEQKPANSRPASSSASKGNSRYHPYKDQGRKQDPHQKDRPKSDAWKRFGKHSDKSSSQAKHYSSKPAKGAKQSK